MMKLLFIAIAMVFLAGCTAEQWDKVISKIPSPESGPSAQEEPTATPPSPPPPAPPQAPVATPLPPAPPKPPVATAERACFDLVQDKIAWDYKGSKRWSPTNVQRLCRDTTNASQPPACFNRVMHGQVNWGGGSRWNWQNAINLCEGTNNSAQTIACFQKGITAKQTWQQAINACQTR